MPNNATVSVIVVGTVHLSPSVTLHNVSFIPNFAFNLLSVRALLTNSAYSICFSSNQFVIQEMPHYKKIGRGDLLQGLYVLNFKDTHSTYNVSVSNSYINVVSNTCTQAINWHNHFGHVLDSVLKVLSKKKIPFSIPNVFSTNSCYVCPIAKFRRSSFPSVNNVSDKPFDLIHCDVWGTYKHSTYDNNRYFLTIVDDCS